jgi:nicotinamide phosphoribosyltransferase
MAALVCGKDYYDAGVAGFSIPASEHSTITSWGMENEVDACRNMLEQYPSGMVACVSDSYDIFNACRNIWGGDLKDMVASRDGRLVVRPDSGDAPSVCLNCLEILGEKFGYTVNEKGYKVLDEHVRVIQGDNPERGVIYDVLDKIVEGGWAAENLAFGMGGALLQKLNRDTLKFAFKCSSITVNGEERDVFKDPVTDSGKVSKRGKLKLAQVNGKFITVSSGNSAEDHLETVFKDGELVKDITLEDIRKEIDG